MKLYAAPSGLSAPCARSVRRRHAPGIRRGLREGTQARPALCARLPCGDGPQHPIAGVGERLPRMATFRSFLSVDVRDAFRSLRATPVVTIVAVLSLALGIGANTALFSILYSLVLKPLPVASPSGSPCWSAMSGPTRSGNRFASGNWSSSKARSPGRAALQPVARRRRRPGRGAYVSGTMFRTLGITTMLWAAALAGRRHEGRRAGWIRGGRQSSVLAAATWRQQRRPRPRLDAQQRALYDRRRGAGSGSSVRKSGSGWTSSCRIAAEGAIRGPEATLDNRSSWWLQVMVRLKRGQTVRGRTPPLNGSLGGHS